MDELCFVWIESTRELLKVPSTWMSNQLMTDKTMMNLNPRSPPTLSFRWREPTSNGFQSPFGTRDVKILNPIHLKSIIIVHIICIHFPWLGPHDFPKFQQEEEEGHTLLPLAKLLLWWHMSLRGMGGCRNETTFATLQASHHALQLPKASPHEIFLPLENIDTNLGSKPIRSTCVATWPPRWVKAIHSFPRHHVPRQV